MSQKEDFDNFRRDYPAVYEKWLEMNRALARLLREKSSRSAEPTPASVDPSEFVGLELD